MNSCELVALITTVAITISDQIQDNDELALIAASLTQLGDTLATISTQRSLQESKTTNQENNSST
ncbi:DUF6774 domain-containing protein [Sinanaerobacter chloroacetimidivorans]|jgi:hypothetical protein|uniref:DUF6774 domain-containing protein n=1 Tax=Sinanaerobacter chloroacetimidivorans TaxID=2818044 RepID=A0A8J8B2F6_9FIRM|nr:DUF6774 domain-containing protein [Sinanaerobacter chloroacetimidivorans]MBR0597205.1 hypothetical protein [Sinanaerobacter chloroacetimidivorans]